ncbi:hypothetical protein K402DRAFT_419928 [Aulographum hederae CBS 113979]|uniref:Uncharacterized protein n=1 Tax=Aulographum hederae CBS 113979 TaxID=1176131 RepID=A0A6G1H506_9PEZI|nr:hypothetical protein K402DRAFT_419928 [Aulographum hederae CBS 113979]
MGGRLSMPRSPDRVTEISRPTAPRGVFSGRTLTAPLAALTMAGILFVYSRSSIRAAKQNAQKHREADGGQMNWLNESSRRHGLLEKVEKEGTLKQAFTGGRADHTKPSAVTASRDATKEQEEALKSLEEAKQGRPPPI